MHLLPPSRVADPLDRSQEVVLELADGRRVQTVFFPDPKRRGRHWFEDQTMSIVDMLTRQNVMAAVNDFIDRDVVDSAFGAFEGTNPYQPMVLGIGDSGTDSGQNKPGFMGSPYAWLGVFLMNLPVPLFFSTIVARNTAVFGVAACVMCLLGLGVVVAFGFPHVMRVVSMGGVVTATSQFVPVLQMFAGLMALRACEDIGLSVEGDDLPQVTGFLAGFCTTALTAGIVIVAAGVVGAVIHFLLNPKTAFRTPSYDDR